MMDSFYATILYFYVWNAIFVTLTMWIDKSHKNHFVYAREKAVTPVNPYFFDRTKSQIDVKI